MLSKTAKETGKEEKQTLRLRSFASLREKVVSQKRSIGKRRGTNFASPLFASLREKKVVN